MHLPENLVEGRFLLRCNRFLVRARVPGGEVEAHLPNPGRLRELLLPGVPVLLRPTGGGGRKTAYDLFAVHDGGEWITVDSRLPNLLFREAFEDGLLEAFSGYGGLEAGVHYGESVIDFLLYDGIPCLVEVKGCTLVREETALFPDAPTSRGTRHLEELAAAVEAGLRACMVVTVQRSGAEVFTTNDAVDPAFGRAARSARRRGVEFLAFRTLLTRREIRLGTPLPVDLDLGPRLAERSREGRDV